jgi:hypothetical protein
LRVITRTLFRFANALEHFISGEHLPYLNHAYLSDMEVNLVGERMRLLIMINHLQKVFQKRKQGKSTVWFRGTVNYEYLYLYPWIRCRRRRQPKYPSLHMINTALSPISPQYYYSIYFKNIP